MTIKIYQDMDGCVCDFALAIRDEIVRLSALSDEEIAGLESKTLRVNGLKWLLHNEKLYVKSGFCSSEAMCIS